MRFLTSLVLIIVLPLLYSCSDMEPVSANSDQTVEYAQSDLQAFESLAKNNGKDRDVRVLTRNIYIGADVDVVLGAQNPNDIPILAAQAFQEMLFTNFPERAISLAREIAFTKPDLIGLQEVTLLRLQDPGDAVMGGTSPAEDVFMDYLEIFMQTLDAMGLDYHVAGVIENADVEIPMLTGVDPYTFADIRVTDYDVILAKEGVEYTDVMAQNYTYNLTVPGANIEVLRGFVAIDAKVGDRAYRFVNTHLEAFAEPIRLAQAQELLGILAGEPLPVILVGDFNSPAPTGAVYNLVLSEGYEDVWTENIRIRDPEGFTFGHASNLMNPTANFYERIDFIFFRYARSKFPLRVHAIVVGDEPFNRTVPTGLWPSDHGGVAARLFLPPNIPPKFLAGTN